MTILQQVVTSLRLIFKQLFCKTMMLFTLEIRENSLNNELETRDRNCHEIILLLKFNFVP